MVDFNLFLEPLIFLWVLQNPIQLIPKHVLLFRYSKNMKMKIMFGFTMGVCKVFVVSGAPMFFSAEV